MRDVLAQYCDQDHERIDPWLVQPTKRVTRNDANLWYASESPHIHGKFLTQSPKRLDKRWRKLSVRGDPRKEFAQPNEMRPVRRRFPHAELEEAKSRRFSPERKHERVAESLAALKQPSRIKLTANEWRQIVEDIDLEDQF